MNMIFDKYEFSKPVKISKWEPPESRGLYAILKTDIHVERLPFKAIYFGQTENFAGRGFIESHGKYECWEREVGSKDDIFIATYPMPGSTEEERKTIEAELIAQYQPACND